MTLTTPNPAIMVPEEGLVTDDGQHKLMRQGVFGRPEYIENIYQLLGVEKPEALGTHKRRTRASGEDPRVLLVHPTENEDKINPNKDWIQSILPQNTQYDDDAKTVDDTGVGEQPRYKNETGDQKGLLGMYNRLIDRLEDVRNLGSERLSQYDAIFILSAESDVASNTPEYDAPNIGIYECFTGEIFVSRGCGPQVPTEWIEIAIKRGGFADNEKLCGNITFGSIGAELFKSEKIKNSGWKGKITKSNWHEAVCGIPRPTLIREALDLITPKLEAKLADFQFDTPASSLSMRRM